jgi:G3E family GTPase
MIDLYVVTGFLGSGKTTFIRNFLPLFAGRKTALLVNEFGRESVDDKLLEDLGAVLSGVSGGSIFCTCRFGEFEAELGRLLAQSPEVLIIETSGFSDPAGIRQILADPKYGALEKRACICLADYSRFKKVYASARTVRKQLAACDVVLLNKADLASAEERAETRSLIAAQRPDILLVETSFGVLPADPSPLLNPPGGGGAAPGMLSADIAVHSVTVKLDRSLSSAEAEKILAFFAEDTYRIKGFLCLKDGVFLADCVGSAVKLSPWEGGADNRVSVLYGHSLPARKSIEKAMEWYPGGITLAGES